MKKIFISNTIKKITLWNAIVMFSIYIAFVLYTLFVLNYVLIDDLDTRLRHELEHLLNTIEISSDSLIIKSSLELEEEDFQKVTESPFFLQVYNLEGVIYLESNNLKDYHKILVGFPNKFSPYFFESFNSESDELRAIYTKLYDKNNNHAGYVQLSTIHSSFNQVVKSVFWFNIFTLPIVILSIIVISIFLARKNYSPINKIIELANKISATQLSERLDYSSIPDDELGRLKFTLNSLFERLENQIDQMSHFTDNASHQLMTPLTTMKTELDFILKKDRVTDEYKETCSILQNQTDKMISLIRTMLLLAKNCDDCSAVTNVFDLTKLLRGEISKNFSNKNVLFEIENNIFLRGKPEYFNIVLNNLINNAIKYSSLNSEVKVKAYSSKKKIKISVTDNGIGIKDENKNKIFDRFYRIENDVNNVEGYGLGLSLVKSVVESMGGSIKVKDNIPSGTIFILSLPTIKLN